MSHEIVAPVAIETDMRPEYVGWVPTISGRLLLRRAECSLGKKKVWRADSDRDSTGEPKYNILVHSLVDWNDAASQDPDATGLCRVTLMTSFLYGADKLSGRVYIAPTNIDIPAYDAVESHIRSTCKASQSLGGLEEECKKIEASLEALNTHKVYRINFTLDRLGFVELQFDSRGSDKFDSFFRFVLSRQAYYYIKYTWHKHKHHAPTAESLTTIHRITDDPSDDGSEMLNDLKQSIVTLKRDHRPYRQKSLIQARGILSYAKSLALSLKVKGHFSENQCQDEEKYLNNMGDSFTVLDLLQHRDLETDNKIATNFRSNLLLVLALVVPMALVFNPDLNAKEALAVVIRKLFGDTSGSTAIIYPLGFVGVLYVAYFQFKKRFGSIVNSSMLVRDFLDYSIKNRKLVSKVVYFLMAFFIVVALAAIS